VDVTQRTMTIEAIGTPDKVQALLSLLEDYGVVEMSRTGRIALARGDRGIRERVMRPVGGRRASGGEDLPDWTGGGV